MRFSIPILLLAGVSFLNMAAALSAADARFTVGFVDGNRVQGAEIVDWFDTKDPLLDKQKLFDPAKPVRWILDNSLPLAEMPAAFVEFIGGDRLPGRVTAYSSGAESPYRRLPPHLFVEADVKLDWPDAPRPRGVPVLTRWLRRIVWERRDDARYHPGTLFYKDGRQVEFRAVRWSSGEVRLLLEQETRTVRFGQIAELHLPRVDPWNVWYEQLAALAPDGTATIMQLETADGVRATASSERFQPLTRGGGDQKQWYHLVQPAWCLEPLWLAHRTIRVRRYFRANEVPLTALDPIRTVQRSVLGGGWIGQVDRNVKGGPLASGENPFGWGFGVQSYSELEFELPALAKSFRTQLGLDMAAGQGGCVRAAIFAGPVTGPPLFQSKHLIGSMEVLDTGALALAGPANAPRRLTLVVDPAHADRPAGADPFEIRDTFDWLQPLVELDPDKLKIELQRRGERLVPAWQDWVISDAENSPAVVWNVWDALHPQQRLYRFETSPRQGFFSLSRRLDVSPEHEFLMIAVSRWDKNILPSRIQLRIEGRAVAEFDVPVRPIPADPDPLLFPIEPYRGRSIEVEVVHLGEGPRSLVDWRGIALVEHDPVLFRLFEDEPRFLNELHDGDSIVRLDSAEKYAGESSLKMTPGERANPAMPGWNLPIRGYPNLGEYRFIRFAWKQEGGHGIGLHLARSGQFALEQAKNSQDRFRYQSGKEGKEDYGKAVPLKSRPDKDWDLVTRDLFGDFGDFDLTGLRLVCADGSAALFDHIYLARRQEDFERLPTAKKKPPPDLLANFPAAERANVLAVTDDPKKYGDLLSAVAPQFSTALSAGGVVLFREFNGRPNVVRTHPPQHDRPCVLRSPLAIPKDKRTELRLTVSHHPKADWQLIVKAGGEKLHDSIIGEKSVKDGWAAVAVDLSKFAGQRVVLEVLDQSNNNSSEFAYWGKIEVVSK